MTHWGFLVYTDLMKNNIIQFEEFKQQLKLKRKVKYKKYRHKYYVAIPKIKHRCVQGFHSSKKEFLKETVEIFKQLFRLSLDLKTISLSSCRSLK